MRAKIYKTPLKKKKHWTKSSWFHEVLILLQEGEPLPGPESGLLSHTHWGTHMLTEQEVLLGKGCLGGEQQGKGTQENFSATWFAVSGFMVMGLVSKLSLANCSVSWWHAQPRGMPVRRILGGGRHLAPPFDFSWTLVVDGGFLASCSLPGPPS